MSKEYDEALTGTRQLCEQILIKIKQYLMKCEETKTTDGFKKQMRYALLILNSICTNTQTGKGVHYDLYTKTIVEILGCHIQPKVAPTHWNRYLEFLRYFHYQMIEKKQYEQCGKVFFYIQSLEEIHQTENDYKFILSIYGTQLLAYRSNFADKQQEIIQVLIALKNLFQAMFRLMQSENYQYNDLIPDFLQYVLGRRSLSTYVYLSSLPEPYKTEMFQSFLHLLKQQQSTKLSTSSQQGGDAAGLDLNHYAADLLELLKAFVNFDLMDKLQMQLALDLLKFELDLKVLQQEEGLHYMLSLLYFMLKMFYNQNVKKYGEVCKKMSSFIQKSGEVLLQEQWFNECLVAFELVHAEVWQKSNPNQSNLFDGVYKQFNRPDLVLEFLRLVYNLMKMSSKLKQSKLMNPQCCTSVKRHFIASLAMSALISYTFFETNYKEKPEDLDLIEEVNKTLMIIFKNFLAMIESMSSCLGNDEQYLKSFFGRFIQLTISCQTPKQVEVCLQLSEALANSSLKSKFLSKDWNILLRRLAKACKLFKDSQMDLQNEIFCCYLTNLINDVTNRDLNLIKNQITLYYAAENSSANNAAAPNTTKLQCLTEVYRKSRSVLKSPLSPGDQRFLYLLEMQHVIRYYKAQIPLLISLIHNKHNDYDVVLLARLCRQHQEPLCLLKQVKESFDCKSFKEMTRLEHLEYGHACATLLYLATEKMKQNFRVDTKECLEANLIETFLKAPMQEFIISNETKLVDLAVKSLKSFHQFWLKADEEFISSDEALIDWEALVDDLGSLAMFLEISGYFQHTTEAWLLFNEITALLQDSQNQIRALAFFCHHVEVFSMHPLLNLDELVHKSSSLLANLLPSLSSRLKRVQTHILLCLSQVAYYHAFKGNYVYAFFLLKLVDCQHSLLADRQGQVDIVICTQLAVRFRILWLHPNEQKWQLFQGQRRSLLTDIELMIEKFQEITLFASTDASTYLILVIEITQQFVECATNRLTDNFYNSFIVAIIKLTIQSGLVLRTMQLLMIWMSSNLQMENVDKAQVKLKINEHLFGRKALSLKDKMKKDAEDLLVEGEASAKKPLALGVGEMILACVEPPRKIAPVHLSPIKTAKLELSPSCRNGDLKRFLMPLGSSDSSNSSADPILNWSYFIMGCLNTRLYYLVEDYDQMESFYYECYKWLDRQKALTASSSHGWMYQKMYENIRTLATQHYVNYLRATQKHSKALKVMEACLQEAQTLSKVIDSSYLYNLKLQFLATVYQKEYERLGQDKRRTSKRVLIFNTSPKEESVASSPTPALATTPAIKALPLKITTKTSKTPKEKPEGKKNESTAASASTTVSVSALKNPEENDFSDGFNESADDEDKLNNCQILDIQDLDETSYNPLPSSATFSIADRLKDMSLETQNPKSSTKVQLKAKGKTKPKENLEANAKVSSRLKRSDSVNKKYSSSLESLSESLKTLTLTKTSARSQNKSSKDEAGQKKLRRAASTTTAEEKDKSKAKAKTSKPADLVISLESSTEALDQLPVATSIRRRKVLRKESSEEKPVSSRTTASKEVSFEEDLVFERKPSTRLKRTAAITTLTKAGNNPLSLKKSDSSLSSASAASSSSSSASSATAATKSNSSAKVSSSTSGVSSTKTRALSSRAKKIVRNDSNAENIAPPPMAMEGGAIFVNSLPNRTPSSIPSAAASASVSTTTSISTRRRMKT